MYLDIPTNSRSIFSQVAETNAEQVALDYMEKWDSNWQSKGGEWGKNILEPDHYSEIYSRCSNQAQGRNLTEPDLCCKVQFVVATKLGSVLAIVSRCSEINHKLL